MLYRSVRVGDKTRLSYTHGAASVTATVETITLGHTVLLDTEDHEVVVPNSVMVSSVVIRLARLRAPSDSGTG